MNLKNKFKYKRKIFGSWISIGDFQLTEILSNLNIDFIGIDLEHSPISIEKFLPIVSICHSKNLSCIPRIMKYHKFRELS